MKWKWNEMTLLPLRGPNLFICALVMVFESRFSAGKIQQISIIFGILNKKLLNFKEMLFIFL